MIYNLLTYQNTWDPSNEVFRAGNSFQESYNPDNKHLFTIL